MSLKWVGGIFVVMGCGYVGFSMAAQYGREMRMLRQMEAFLTCLISELEYKMTDLPGLLHSASRFLRGDVLKVVGILLREMESQRAGDLAACVDNALKQASGLPVRVRRVIQEVGTTLGRFDLSGQVRALEDALLRCKGELKQMEEEASQRTRSYQTLGLCAGAALAVLFI